MQEVQIDDLINKAKLGFLDHKYFEIIPEIDDEVEKIITDPDMLEQVILNGIQNSFQATEGQSKVYIRVEKQAGFARFIITDEGPGIDETISSKIFEPFFSTREKGSGLGLAISKQLCEQLGGSIHISSMENQGTSLTFLIPLKGA
jgi:signal transduction histidine kinase